MVVRLIKNVRLKMLYYFVTKKLLFWGSVSLHSLFDLNFDTILE